MCEASGEFISWVSLEGLGETLPWEASSWRSKVWGCVEPSTWGCLSEHVSRGPGCHHAAWYSLAQKLKCSGQSLRCSGQSWQEQK